MDAQDRAKHFGSESGYWKAVGFKFRPLTGLVTDQLLGISQRTLMAVFDCPPQRFSPRKLVPVNVNNFGDQLHLARIKTARGGGTDNGAGAGVLGTASSGDGVILSPQMRARISASTSARGVAYLVREAAITLSRRICASASSGNSGLRNARLKSASLRSTRTIA